MKPEDVLRLMELLEQWRNGNQEVVKEILERTINVE